MVELMEIKKLMLDFFKENVDRYSLHPQEDVVQRIGRVFDILSITEGINEESVIDNGLHLIEEHSYSFDEYKRNFMIELGTYYASLDTQGDSPKYFYEAMSLADSIRIYLAETISEDGEPEDMIYFRLYFRCNNGGTENE